MLVKVEVDSYPRGALVRIGETDFGQTPIRLDLELGAKYELKFLVDGDVRTIRNIRASKKSKLLVNLPRDHSS